MYRFVYTTYNLGSLKALASAGALRTFTSMNPISVSSDEQLHGVKKFGYYPLMAICLSGLISWSLMIIYLSGMRLEMVTVREIFESSVILVLFGYVLGLFLLLIFRGPRVIPPTERDFAEAKCFAIWANPLTLPLGILRTIWRFCQLVFMAGPWYHATK